MEDLEKIQLKGKYSNMDLVIPFGLSLTTNDEINENLTNTFKGVINNEKYNYFLNNSGKEKTITKLTRKNTKDHLKKTKKQQK
tara:strand:+ start:107 stop:355 length:249 start_codon:yes stop_codon:yes gene_type:complete